MPICRTIQCEEEAARDYCPKCQAGHRYWEKKRPAQVLKRRNDLQRFSARVNRVIGNRMIGDD